MRSLERGLMKIALLRVMTQCWLLIYYRRCNKLDYCVFGEKARWITNEIGIRFRNYIFLSSKKKSVKFAVEQATKRYNSTLSATSAPDGVGGQRHAPSRFTPGNDPVPIV
jgi:hypothetical protein